MCGIVGVRWSWLEAQRRDAEAAFACALQRLQWRGPDAVATLRVGGFALGCARLAITGPRSRQPLLRRGARFGGVLNGAITNARQLWGGVAPRLLRRSSLPNDAWLPIQLLAAARPAELTALTGHHALAVVDAATDRLWLARDAAGEKPLFVVLERGRPVAFASTLPALAALGIAARLPAAAVARFFRFGCTDAEFETAPGLAIAADLAGVHTADGGGELRPLPAAPTVAGQSQSTSPTTALATLLAAAVARCSEVAVPWALSLSGGLDSSCIAAAMAAAGRRAPAYQFRAAGSDGSERELARAVAAHCQLPFRAVDGGPEVLDALPELTSRWGLPLGDPSLLAVHALARAAAADGVRVLLSGEGADEALLGYARHRIMRWCPSRGLFRWPARGWSMARAARLWRAATAADPYAELLSVSPPAFRQAALAPEFAAGELPAIGGAPGGLGRARAVDRAHYLRWDLLPKLDVATMAAGIEGRCPYLDQAFAAAAAAVPAAAALGKRPLRAAFGARLPAAVLRQKKRGFALPLDRWFRGELKWLDLLREARTRSRPHLRPGGIDLAIDRHRRGRADLGHALYLLVAYELYLRAGEP